MKLPSYRWHAPLFALAVLSLSSCSSSTGEGTPTGGTSSGGTVASGGNTGGTTNSGGSGGASTGGTTKSGGNVGGSTGGGGASGGTKATGGTIATGGTGGSTCQGNSCCQEAYDCCVTLDHTDSDYLNVKGGCGTLKLATSSDQLTCMLWVKTTKARGKCGGLGGAGGGGGASGGSGGGGSGGAASGGSTGGASGGATGGSASGGATGGSASGGAGGAGGTQAKTSKGCGSTSPLKSGNFTDTIDGTARKWVLDVPANYDTNKPYRLIFTWHPLGGSAAGVVADNYYGLKPLSNGTAIFVTADGLQGSNSETSGVGWWNVNGVDMKLLQTMLDKVNASLCVDQDRIFSTGFSFGGMMTYSVGFEFKVFRAIAPCSGKEGVIKYNANNSDPLPIIGFHGDNDTFVLTSLGRAFRDKYVARNKCGTQTQPVSPSPCVQYQGCVAPTIWCEFPGGHNTWSEEPKAIWNFFSQF